MVFLGDKALKDLEVRAAIAKMLKQIERIDAKVSQMPQVQIQVSSRLLPTLVALQKIGSGTATQISLMTSRGRAFESKNLNELHMLGAVTKQTTGRAKIFKVKDPNVFKNNLYEKLNSELNITETST
jgi:hypothetical protein